jgi:hypothetical protein
MFDSEPTSLRDRHELLAEIHHELTSSEEAALWAEIRSAYGSEPWNTPDGWPDDDGTEVPDGSAGRVGAPLPACSGVLDPSALDSECPPRFPFADDELATLNPGGDLAVLLERADTRDIDDFTLVDVVAAWDRLVSWASAHAALAAADLADRRSMNPAWPPTAGHVTQPCVAGDELAMRLGCSRRSGALLVRDGRAFAGPLAWTGEALARGEIDRAKARVIVDRLDGVPVPVALAVQDLVLDGAARRTPTQLAQDVARALIEVDPEDAELRHDRARQGRRVDHPRALADGMAGLWAVLPATEAARLDTQLDTAARSARAAGDSRTLDQLRADTLSGLVSGEGPLPSADTPARPPRRVRPAAQVRVTVPLSTLMGIDGQAGELAGYGPVTPDVARALAAGGVWRRLVTDPLSGAVLDVGRTRYRPPRDPVARPARSPATSTTPWSSTGAHPARRSARRPPPIWVRCAAAITGSRPTRDSGWFR